MKVLLCVLSVMTISLSDTLAHPEAPPPFGSYSAPPPGPGPIYSAPGPAPINSYGAPPGPPPISSYGAPPPVYGAPPQIPLIHKHVYVHVPPPEQEYHRPRKPIYVAPPQKHYKIVFIKAPTPPTPTAPIIPVQPQDEQKTLIYVLVKKPEEAPEINIPTPAPTQPSKPEVYFIRYKTQKQEGYPDSGVPQNQYGPPVSPPGGEYGAPPPPPSAHGY